MKNQDRPAMPATVCIKDESNQRYKKDYINVSCYGLTKLEHFAGLAMQGLIESCSTSLHDYDIAADFAVRHAKSLLAELEKEKISE